jgi:tetratricopeptide (TPR) repeat protein
MERARRKPTTSLTAYDLFLRALPPRRDNSAQNEASLSLLYQAIELDPTYGTAYGLAAWCYEIQTVFGWLSRSDPRVKEGIRLANLAAEHGENDPDALWMAGLSLATLAGELERAQDLIGRSLSINPNSARAWWASGIVRTYLGQQNVALDHLARSRRLNPLDTAAYAYWAAIATAHFFAGDLDAALAAVEKALTDWADAPAALRLKAAMLRVAPGLYAVRDHLLLHPWGCQRSERKCRQGRGLPVLRNLSHAVRATIQLDRNGCARALQSQPPAR